MSNANRKPYKKTILKLFMAFGMFGSKHKEQHMMTLDQLEHHLRTEFDTVDEIEHNLIQELEEIQHLETNIKLIESYIVSLRTLADKRKHIYDELGVEMDKPPTEIDVERALEWITMIQRIDEQLSPRIAYLGQEIHRYRLDDTHELYAKFYSEKERMKEVHKTASRLRNEIRTIIGTSNQSQNALSGIHKTLQVLKEQRLSNKEKAKLGFGK